MNESVLDDGEKIIYQTPKQRQESAPRKPRTVSKDTQVKLFLGQVVGLANMGLAFVSPEDMLTEQESMLLVTTGTAEAKEWPQVYNWLAKASRISVHGAFAMVCVAIALPRLERHGMLPEGIGAFAKPILASVSGDFETAATVSVESGRTSSDSGPDAERQNDDVEPHPRSARVRRYPPNQNGQGEVSGGSQDSFGIGNDVFQAGPVGAVPES